MVVTQPGPSESAGPESQPAARAGRLLRQSREKPELGRKISMNKRSKASSSSNMVSKVDNDNMLNSCYNFRENRRRFFSVCLEDTGVMV